MEEQTIEDSLSEEATNYREIPEGHQGLVLRGVFFLLGVGSLVPWNAFVSAPSYFASRLCHHEGDASDQNIESTFSIIYNLSAALSLGMVIGVQWLYDQWKARNHDTMLVAATPSIERRNDHHEEENKEEEGRSCSDSFTNDIASGHSFWLVMVPLSVYFAVFLGQCVMVLSVGLSPGVFYTLTVISLACCGICTALASSGIVAMAAFFPSNMAMNPFLTGQSFGGLAVSAATFMAAGSEDPQNYQDLFCSNNETSNIERREADQETTCIPYHQRDIGVFFYFAAASVVLAMCLVGYAWIDRYQRGRHRDNYENINDEMPAGLVVDNSPRVGLELKDGIMNIGGGERIDVDTTDVLEMPIDNDEHTHHYHHHMHETMNETQEVWTVVRAPAVSIYLVFFVTLSLFPGYVSQLHSIHQCQTHSRLRNDLYTPAAFILFNGGDFCGRILASQITPHLEKITNLSAKLVVATLVRFIAFPLFFLCPAGSSQGGEGIVGSDMFSFLVQVLFAVTNGLFLSLAFVHAPSLLPNVTHVQERSSELLNFALALGLLSGSFLSYPISNLAN